MFKRSALALLLSVGLAAPLAAETPKDVLVSAWQFDDIITMDPGNMFEISTFEVTGNVYDTLVAFDLDDTAKIYGVAAESWTVSDDGRTYTFRIRDGIKFHSGRPLTARDVEYSYRRMVLMDGSPAFLLTDLGPSADNVNDTIKALDDRTFQLVVGDDYAPSYVLNVLTAGNFAIVDAEEVKANEKDGDMGKDWLKTNSAGSGPFVLRSWKPNESITIDRNDAYWGGAAKLKRIVWRHIPEPATQRLLLEKGDIDIARNLPADQLDPLKALPQMAIAATPQGTNYYLGLNVKNEHFAKPQVRLAMKFLIDYEGMGKTFLRDVMTVNQSFLPYGFLGQLRENPFKLDVAKAKTLLAEAGYPDGFKVTMDVRNNWPTMDMAQAIQASLKQGGIDLEILPGDGKTTLTKYRARKHDIYIGRWGVDYFDPNSNAVFVANSDNSDDARSKPLAWRNAWQDEEMTTLAAALVKERDATKRAAGYQQLIRLSWDRAPFVMMYQQNMVAAYNKRVKDFRLGPSADSTKYRATAKD